jgi:hypothetical protein
MSVPQGTTVAATDVTLTTATSGGSITDDGGETLTRYGVCWSTSPNPTVADAHTDDIPAPPPEYPDYFVATTGSNANDGSQAYPWLTVQYAVDHMPAGRKLGVAAGTYSERVTIPSSRTGAAGAETQVLATGAAVVTGGFDVQAAYCIIDGFEVTPGTTTFTDNEANGQVYVKNHHVTLRNLNLHDLTRGSGISLQCSAPIAHYATIEDCDISKPAWSGITVQDGGNVAHPDDVTITGTHVHKFGGWQAIKAYGDRWLIEDCEVQGPTYSVDTVKANQDGDGINVNYAANTIIRRTKIYDIWNRVSFTSNGYHADAIQLWSNVTNLLVDGCTLGSWKAGGPDDTPGPVNLFMVGTVNTACDVTVQNCLFLCGIDTGALKSNTHPGCSAGNSSVNVATVRLYNNTFIGNYPAWNGQYSSVTAYNNVFYSHRSGYHADTSDYNAFLWNQWTDSGVSSGDLQSSTVSTAEAAAGSHCLGKTYATRLVAADLFEDPDVTATTDYGLTADFTPKAGSVLIGAADPAYAPDHDIRGRARHGTTPTIGAYEMLPPVQTTAASATLTASSAVLTKA